MRVILRLKLSVQILLVHTLAFGQSIDIQQSNVSRVDNFVLGISNICGGKLLSPSGYKRKWVKKDGSIIKLFNEIADKSLTENGLDNIVRNNHLKYSDEILNNGLIHARVLKIQGKYLLLSCTIDFAKDVIVHQKLVIETKTSSSCGPFLNMYLDYQIIKTFFLSRIARVISPDFTSIVFDTTYTENIRSIAPAESGFKFSLPDSTIEPWVNNLILGQYRSESYRIYNLQVPPKEFLQMVQSRKTDLLVDLLYSPNYCVSINAMEALIFLNNTRAINFTSDELKQMTNLRSERVEIISQIAPDAFYPVSSYSELKMTDDRIIAKYKASL